MSIAIDVDIVEAVLIGSEWYDVYHASFSTDAHLTHRAILMVYLKITHLTHRAILMVYLKITHLTHRAILMVYLKITHLTHRAILMVYLKITHLTQSYINGVFKDKHI